MENPEHHGEECVNYIKNKIKEFEVLTPMTFALKTILQKAFLNDPYKGGLSSYGVILLIINFLNVQNKQGNDISLNNLGKLFYDILYYYGFEYDISNPVILEEKTDFQKIILPFTVLRRFDYVLNYSKDIIVQTYEENKNPPVCLECEGDYVILSSKC